MSNYPEKNDRPLEGRKASSPIYSAIKPDLMINLLQVPHLLRPALTELILLSDQYSWYPDPVIDNEPGPRSAQLLDKAQLSPPDQALVKSFHATFIRTWIEAEDQHSQARILDQLQVMERLKIDPVSKYTDELVKALDSRDFRLQLGPFPSPQLAPTLSSSITALTPVGLYMSTQLLLTH